MKLSFIGAGNVAWHLAQAFDKADHQVLEVYSRKPANAQKLCGKLYSAEVQSDLDFTDSRAEMVIIAVPDDAIEEIAAQLLLRPDVILLHTSGTRTLEALKTFSGRKGIFYPLQTFTKEKKVNFRNIPVCLEAGDSFTENILEKLAFTICDNVCFVDAEDRKTLHLAAVFACNFTNYLLRLSKEILEENGLDFEILKPLINETVEKALLNGPEHAQTGPASRGDQKVIFEHLQRLSSFPQRQEIYRIITEGIANAGKQKK